MSLTLPSPFDLEEQGELRLIANAPSPRDEDAHTAAVTSVVQAHHAPGEGTLVLFTSHRQMKAVMDCLPDELRSRTRLQSDGDIPGLLKAHAADVAAGMTSILMGVAAFAEGLDLPGALCRALIIAKLPFAVPDDPIERARADACEARGGNAFAAIALPDTQLRLTQAFGRLVRTETDRGWVVVVDARLSGTRYGRALLEHLPPFRRSSLLLADSECAPVAPAAHKPRAKSRHSEDKRATGPADTRRHGRLHLPSEPRKPPRPPSGSSKRRGANRDLFLGLTATGRSILA